MATEREASVQAAFLSACRLDVQARKPGNVSFVSAGHRMHADLFIASAEAAVGPLCTPGLSVGARIDAAMRATLSVVHCNTNLGILLLCAPLAAAAQSVAEHADAAVLRGALDAVLHDLDVADAQAAFHAIAAANPAGLGTAADQDVAQPPSVGLREAMTLAADRDLIAAQYTNGFNAVFETGLPAWQAALARDDGDPPLAMQSVFFAFLAAHPDSHIVRKHGEALAQSVMTEAQPWRALARSGGLAGAAAALAAWDEALKLRGINPGTCADLSVATAFVAALTGLQR
jgi:triphosphoribosyl-dephospho-CoA synthase